MSKTSWLCPYCNDNSTIDSFEDVKVFYEHIEPAVKDKHYLIFIESIICPAPKCRQIKLTLHLSKTKDSYAPEDRVYLSNENEWGLKTSEGRPINIEIEEKNYWELLPEASIKPYPDYIPKAVIEDYKEACLIKDKSPKASATLSRRCLQTMIRDFWKIRDKPNLKEEIDSIRDKVDGLVWRAIEGVRNIGNIGAHMARDVNLIIDIESEEAGKLIWLIEFLIEKWYVRTHEDKEELKGIDDISVKKDEQKNNVT